MEPIQKLKRSSRMTSKDFAKITANLIPEYNGQQIVNLCEGYAIDYGSDDQAGHKPQIFKVQKKFDLNQ